MRSPGLLDVLSAVCLFLHAGLVASPLATTLPAGGDFTPIQHPLKHFAFARIREGVLPFWTDLVYAGYPFLASGEHGLWSPLNLPFLFASTEVGFFFAAWLQLFLAAWGAFLFVRAFAHPVAALPAACFVSLALAMKVPEFSLLTALSPVALLFHLPSSTKRRRGLCWIPLSLSFLAGHSQLSVYIFLTFAAYVAAGRIFTRRGQTAPFLAAPLALGVLTSLPLLWPQFELFLDSGRFPTAPAPAEGAAPFRQGLPFILTAGVIALWALPRRRAPLPFRLLPWIVLVLFLVALGDHGPFGFLQKLPLISGFRGPAKWVDIALMLLTLEAGLGLGLLHAAACKRRLTAVANLFCFLLALAFSAGAAEMLAFPLRHATLAEIIRWEARKRESDPERQPRRVPHAVYQRPPAYADFLRLRLGGGGRYYSSDWLGGALRPNLGLLYDLRAMEGYFPLQPRLFAPLYYVEPGEQKFGFMNQNVADLFGVRFVLVPSDTARDAPDLGLDPRRQVFADPQTVIYENTTALPPWTFRCRSEHLTPSEQAVARLRAPDFDLSTVVVTDGPIEVSESRCEAEITIRQSRATRHRLVVTTAHHGYLVHAETFLRHWRGYVNGKRKPLHRAYGYAMALYLSPGRHEVELRYLPVSFYVVSALSCGALAWAGLSLRNKRRSPAS